MDFEQCSDLLGFVVAKDREVVGLLLSLLWFVFSVPGSSHKAPGLVVQYKFEGFTLSCS